MSKGLGVRQQHMLDFAKKHTGMYYMSSSDKNVALSLERRNLITIGREYGQWYFQAKETQ